jgi:ATP-binding cassette subfamily B protein
MGFTASLKPSLMMIAGVLLVVVPIVLFGCRVRKLARATRGRVADQGNRIDETIRDIRKMQAYGHGAADRGPFGAGVERGFGVAQRCVTLRPDAPHRS